MLYNISKTLLYYHSMSKNHCNTMMLFVSETFAMVLPNVLHVYHGSSVVFLSMYIP